MEEEKTGKVDRESFIRKARKWKFLKERCLVLSADPASYSVLVVPQEGGAPVAKIRHESMRNSSLEELKANLLKHFQIQDLWSAKAARRESFIQEAQQREFFKRHRLLLQAAPDRCGVLITSEQTGERIAIIVDSSIRTESLDEIETGLSYMLELDFPNSIGTARLEELRLKRLKEAKKREDRNDLKREIERVLHLVAPLRTIGISIDEFRRCAIALLVALREHSERLH